MLCIYVFFPLATTVSLCFLPRLYALAQGNIQLYCESSTTKGLCGEPAKSQLCKDGRSILPALHTFPSLKVDDVLAVVVV